MRGNVFVRLARSRRRDPADRSRTFFPRTGQIRLDASRDSAAAGRPPGRRVGIEQTSLQAKPGRAAGAAIEAVFAAPAYRLIAFACSPGSTKRATDRRDGQRAARLGAAPAAVESVLKKAGSGADCIFARSLAECLALHSPSVPVRSGDQAVCDLPACRRRSRRPLRRLWRRPRRPRRHIAEILPLDPKPGLAYARSRSHRLPDVFVSTGRTAAGRRLNDEALPRLIVNRVYFATVAARASCEAT